jgi:hypothetical protein
MKKVLVDLADMECRLEYNVLMVEYLCDKFAITEVFKKDMLEKATFRVMQKYIYPNLESIDLN